ncbi:hypothetical protein DEA8626_01247 [Defluviimonas aquaemixtae]|uniref:DUF2127 domain-containing protein n=1 Tax=Albidovulum aquaemixtae TaxID=1542388 RepID=A0A2R8B525_9RHOB|nr:hypothetical protein DEA8626_01247 [Defluviimonas aquaemixtae]
MHQVFELSIAAKALFALVETLSGIGVFLVRAEWVQTLARWLTASELNEDPADALARWTLHLAEGFSVSTQHFWALYLFSHGAVKLLALGALVSGARWGYPLSIVVLCGFIALQMHRFVLTHSVLMLGLTVFDLAVIWLIWREYRSLPQTRGG